MKYYDQISRTVNIPEFPSRIISLVPSITELLSHLGLDQNIVGITKFCVHPDHIFKSKTKIGGTKKINFDTIDELRPDLIIANKEENTQSDIKQLESKYPVWVSDVNSYNDALSLIREIGVITGKKPESENVIEQIEINFRSVNKLTDTSVLYLIWKNPFMSVGSDTYINDMLNQCGLVNVMSNHDRYPELNNDLIGSINPDVVLLSSEPYPFKENDIKELQSIFPDSKILLADGEYYSWYGSRMIKAPSYFNQINSYITNTTQSV